MDAFSIRSLLKYGSRCEAMVFNLEGRPLQGLTGGYGNERRVEFILKDVTFAQGYYIEVSANGMITVEYAQFTQLRV